MTDKKTQLKRQATQRSNLKEERVEALIVSIESFLRRNLSRILEDLRADKLSAKEAAKALGGLETAIEESGLEKYFVKVKELFAIEFQAVREEFRETTGKAALLGKFTRQNLEALVDDRITLAASYVSDYIGDVRAAVLDSVIGGVKVKPSDILDTAEGRTLSALKTELNTSLMAYQRITHLEKAKKGGITKFLYVGPDDKITRPFCQERVDKIFTIEEIEKWDNEQGLPASIYCGGYNCRHHLRPISEDLAKELEDK
jgi:hypothetical protein